jgi:hypothetical protein
MVKTTGGVGAIDEMYRKADPRKYISGGTMREAPY